MGTRSVPPVRGKLLSRRWVYRTLREVYLEDGLVIAKRFVHHRGRRDWRRVWAREHNALQRLAGLPVPRSYGHGMHDGPEGREIILRKEYIAGEPLARAGFREAVEMARLLAAIHERMVVTNDPSLANFIRRPDGSLASSISAARARSGSARRIFISMSARNSRGSTARDSRAAPSCGRTPSPPTKNGTGCCRRSARCARGVSGSGSGENEITRRATSRPRPAEAGRCGTRRG